MTSRWERWRLKSPASRLFTQLLIQGADQRKHQSSASLAYARVIHRWPVISPNKWSVTRKMLPFDDVIMLYEYSISQYHLNYLYIFRHAFYMCRDDVTDQMEIFSALLALCAGNSQVTGEFPTQRPVTWSFVVFFNLRLNKRLSKQSWGWSFETPSHPLWRHCNMIAYLTTCWWHPRYW